VLVLRSRWILPIADRPLLNGWVALDRGRVAAVGRAGAALPFRGDAPLVDLGEMAILPALTNAHTHLELSWLHGRIPRAERFTEWLRAQLGIRRTAPPSAEDVTASIRSAIAQVHATGTGFVGDVSNTLGTVDLLRGSLLKGVVFHELVRFRAADADAVLEQGLKALDGFGPSSRVSLSLAPHAPYSVSPLLFQGIRSAWRGCRWCPRRCIWLNRWKKWSFSVRATVRAASCSRISARGIPRGRRRTAGPSSTSHA
jgi:cytosine/adenosine deaminase-related metal-dependent hydrolase